MEPNLSMPFPNDLFYRGLRRLEYEHQQKGDPYRVKAFKKAAEVIRGHGIPIPNGKAAKALPGIGDSIAKRLDDFLLNFNETGQYPDPPPPHFKSGDISKVRDPFSQKPAMPPPLRTAASALEDDFGRVMDDPSQGKRKRAKAAYIPKKRSGNYAILIALVINKRLHPSAAEMTKDQIVANGQKFCDASFIVPGPDLRFTAWSGCDRLVDEGLMVHTGGTPDLFSLTPAGEELAEDLWKASDNDDKVQDAANQLAKQSAKAKSLPLPQATHLSQEAKVKPEKSAVKVKDERPKVKEEVKAEVKTEVKAEVKEGPRTPVSLKRAATDAPVLHRTKQPKRDTVDTEAIQLQPFSPPPASSPSSSSSSSSFTSTPSRRIIRERSPTPPTDTESTPPPEPAWVPVVTYVPPVRSAATTSPQKFTYCYISHDDEHVLRREDAESEIDSDQLTFLIEFPSSQLDHPFIQNVVRTTRHSTPGFHRGYIFEEFSDPVSPSLAMEALATQPPSSLSASTLSQASAPPPAVAPVPALPQPSPSQPLTSAPAAHRILAFEPKSYEIVLLIDSSERQSTRDLQNLVKGFATNKVLCDQRPLPVGDFLWVARHKETKEEIVLNHLAGRKRLDELGGCVADGSFTQEKLRLSGSLVSNIIYLVEERKKKEGEDRAAEIKQEDLDRAIIEAQISERLFLHRTMSLDDTTGYLSMLTYHLERAHSRKKLVAIGGDVSREELQQLRTTSSLENPVDELHISYPLFDRMNRPEKVTSHRNLLVRQLLQIPTMTMEKAQAVTSVYPTLISLIRAYDSLQSEKAKEELLMNIPVGTQTLGLEASRSVHLFYS